MEKLKNGLSIRGDCYYCPLSFQLDTYWNCLTNCSHCFLRRLNRTWGQDLKPLDLELFEKKIISGLKNKNPRSSLAIAVKNKKTIRFGNKTDPYQKAETKYGVTRKAIKILNKYNFTYVIQTKFTENLYRDEDVFDIYNTSFMPIVSPGLERDWVELEHMRTTNPIKRLIDSNYFIKKGFNLGVNGEPFIPGYHKLQDFEDTLKLLSTFHIKSYNTYHLHLNDYNAKKIHEAGLDIEKIWYMNQDDQWRKILIQLIDLSKKYDIVLGCPDFINSGHYQETSNTCCGINVKNPCTFNIINWKKLKQKGYSNEEIINRTWDGVGDYELGINILNDNVKNLYTLKDIHKREL